MSAPLPEIPFDDAMFPDVVTFTPQSYVVGARGGTTPVDGTPINLSCKVEETTNPEQRDEGTGNASSGLPTGLVASSVYFEDPGTGFQPAPIVTDSLLLWISSRGKTYPIPRKLLAKAQVTQQEFLWVVNVREIS